MNDWFDELDADPGPPEGDPDKPPTWAESLGTRDRYERFELEVRHWFKAQGMSVVISDAVVRARSGDSRVTEVGLATIAEACASVPEEEWPALVGAHFEGLYRVHRQHQDLKTSIGGWNEVRKLLVARIWEPESLGETRSAMICREDLPGLVTTLALNLSDHIRSVTVEEAQEWGRSTDTLFETAIDNVEALTTVDVSPIDPAQPDGIYSIFAESVLVAARALRFERFEQLHGQLGTLVSLPVRHAILAVPLRTRETILQSLASLIPVTQQLEREGPGSVSGRVFWWKDKVWREVGYAIKGDRLEVAPPQELIDLIEGNEEKP